MKTILLQFALVLFVATVGNSQGQIFQIGNDNNFAAGVTTDKFKYYASRQKEDVWCWAACIQMVLGYQGLHVDQCDIVKAAFDMPVCIEVPAGCETIEKAAGGWNIRGRRIRAYMDHSVTAHSLINDLAYKYPLIIGLNMKGQSLGHAYVLTAVFYQYDDYNNKRPYKVVLRDPWPDNPSRLELTWQDFFSRINCVTHVTF